MLYGESLDLTKYLSVAAQTKGRDNSDGEGHFSLAIHGKGEGMKIIDYELKGNVVRFYLGKATAKDYHGDDWDDPLTEINGNLVYSEYITGTAEIAFPFDALVLDPCAGERSYNCTYSKNDMKNRTVPCVIVIPPEIAKNSSRDNFTYWAGYKDALRFYFEDPMEPSPLLISYSFEPLQKGFVQQHDVYQALAGSQSAQEGNSARPVPLWEKENRTIEEAASLFGVGQNRIRALTDKRNCDFVLFVGNRRLIKRKKFAKYLETAFSI